MCLRFMFLLTTRLAAWLRLARNYEFPRVPQVESAYRAAHRALEDIVSASEWRFNYAPQSELEFTEVVGQFPSMVQETDMIMAGQIGPRISWEAPQRDEWDLVLAGIDLDADGDLYLASRCPALLSRGKADLGKGVR